MAALAPLGLVVLGLAAGCESTEATTGRAVTVLLVTSGHEVEGSEAERTLRRHIGERGDLELRSMARLATLAAASEDEGADAERAVVAAQRRVAQADEAFSRFDYAGATTQLSEALALLRPSATRPTGRQRLAEVHLSLAMVLLVHGEREAALEELRTCLHIDPSCAPDPARHPPELTELAAEARAPTSRDARLHVETEPPGALVTLDGESGGAAPYDWDQLGPGRHYLTIEQDGFLPEVHLVSVAAGAPTERRFPLTAGPPPMRASAAMRDLLARGPDAHVRWRAQAAALSAADFMVVLRREAPPRASPRLSLGLFDGRGAPVTEVLRAAEAEADVRRFLDDALPRPTVPYYGQWWFWTPIALGVAVALAAGVFAWVNVPSVRLIGGHVVPED